MVFHSITKSQTTPLSSSISITRGIPSYDFKPIPIEVAAHVNPEERKSLGTTRALRFPACLQTLEFGLAHVFCLFCYTHLINRAFTRMLGQSNMRTAHENINFISPYATSRPSGRCAFRRTDFHVSASFLAVIKSWTIPARITFLPLRCAKWSGHGPLMAL